MSERPGFEPFVSLRQALDQLVGQRLGGAPGRTPWSGVTTSLPLDVYATDEALVVLAAAPGLPPDRLEVTVQQGTLVLRGTIPDVAQSAEAHDATWYLHELGSGPFERAIALPFAVDVERAQAGVAQGIVRVVLPKAEPARPTTIPITTGSGTEVPG